MGEPTRLTAADGGAWLGMPAGPGDVNDGASTADRLRADCSRCFALCCVALPFAASADFAIDKPAGLPCVNLRTDDRCGIHSRLRPAGFPGCTVYDCFGAGQRVSREIFGGRSWRGDPDTARLMFAVFPVVRQLHEMLRHLAEAADRAPTGELRARAVELFDSLDALAGSDAATLAEIDVGACRAEVGPLLARVSAAVRGGGGRVLRHADLFGKNLTGADLRGADLRGAQLIAADLAGADLRDADLLGADLRDADVAGADLDGALFLTQQQVDAARGDGGTRLPRSLTRPGHWEPGSAARRGARRRQ
ncbi:pentapeptide repeat-containing protein [Georgenia sp. EYE_87]|uniref:pentapeptide repeat-containing protein n=1 Tax=Georgenia sp. EYE_87 TaxID=2853448 RepID=UPI0027E2E9DF|nr:pentapeptide repeat-containing protein [Georgenia sp. EYE_87]